MARWLSSHEREWLSFDERRSIGFAHLFLAAMVNLGETIETWPPARRGIGDDWV